eukprot:6458919-Amphidinium_carterae.1
MPRQHANEGFDLAACHKDLSLSSQACRMQCGAKLRLWLPRISGRAGCLQATAVELALPASCGRGRPPLDSWMRVLHLSKLADSEIHFKHNVRSPEVSDQRKGNAEESNN